jgi:hypothetical protein
MLIGHYTFAGFIIRYYWAFILGSFVLFAINLARPNTVGSVIELSYYPFYFVIGALTKHLTLRKIPHTLVTLRDTGALTQGAVERLLHSPISRFHTPVGHVIGVLLTLAIFCFYGLYKEETWLRIYRAEFWPAMVVIGIIIVDLLLAYAGGIAIWIVVVTGWAFHYLGRVGELHIRPFHPDRCAGLGSIGQLFFFSSVILVVIVLFFSGWVLYGKWHPNVDSTYADFEPWFIGALFGVGLVSIAVFFFPLSNIHRTMKVEADAYKSKAASLAAQISDLEESLLASASSTNSGELETHLEQIEALRKTYLHYQNIPTWPVDFQTRWQFLTAQVALWVSFLTLSEKIKAILPH